MRFKKEMTIGELYRPAMEITDEAEASRYFEDLVQYGMSYGQSREEAENIQRSNLGYFAGYYDNDTRLRVEKLFACSHPIFGKASSGIPTADKAFEAGQRMPQKER